VDKPIVEWGGEGSAATAYGRILLGKLNLRKRSAVNLKGMRQIFSNKRPIINNY